MSYRARGRPQKPYAHSRRDLAKPEGARRSLSDEGTEGIDDHESVNNRVRLPDIDSRNKDRRARRPLKNENADGASSSRIPQAKARIRAPIANGREDDVVTPVRERFRNRQAQQPAPINGNSDRTTGDEQRKSRINATKKVTFYRNGDKHFQGVKVIITRQRYRSFDTLVEDLSKAIALPYGVRHVFSPGGSSIDEMGQLEDGRIYVCSSGDHLIKHVDYGGNKAREKRQSDSERSLDVHSDTSTLSTNSNTSSRSNRFEVKNEKTKPRVITIISNSDKSKKCKILLNRKTVKSYDSVLKDISDMLKPRDGPVRDLFTLQGSKVRLCISVFVRVFLRGLFCLYARSGHDLYEEVTLAKLTWDLNSLFLYRLKLTRI